MARGSGEVAVTEQAQPKPKPEPKPEPIVLVVQDGLIGSTSTVEKKETKHG